MRKPRVVTRRFYTSGFSTWAKPLARRKTYNNLANTRRRVRDFEGAEEYIQQAIEILQSRPESLSNAMESLSRIREDQGRAEEALAATVRAREIQQSLPTPDLSVMATLYDREALLASRCGEEERSADARSRAGQLRQRWPPRRRPIAI
jgi:tetratricopeptide (TPR) repeat protein